MADDQDSASSDRDPGAAPAMSRLDRTADIVGSALGQAARVVDSLRARHPDPAGEVSDALRKGRAKATRAAARAKRRSKAGMKTAKAAGARVRSTAARARRKTAKALSTARRSTKRGVARAKAVAARVRKTARRLRRSKR